jgi:hypothetical protein
MKNRKLYFFSTFTIASCSLLLYADLKAHDYLVQSLSSMIKRSSAIIEGTVMEIRTGIVS